MTSPPVCGVEPRFHVQIGKLRGRRPHNETGPFPRPFLSNGRHRASRPHPPHLERGPRRRSTCWRACLPAQGAWRAPTAPGSGTSIDEFTDDLNTQRFKKSTMRVCCRRLLAFGEFTATQDVCQVAALPRWIEPFVAQLRAQGPSRHAARLALMQFVRFLQEKKGIPDSTPLPPPAPHAQLIDDYLRFLREQRGLCPGTLRTGPVSLPSLLGLHRHRGDHRPPITPTRDRHPLQSPARATITAVGPCKADVPGSVASSPTSTGAKSSRRTCLPSWWHHGSPSTNHVRGS